MNLPHWQYFGVLCNDLQETTRFVELAADNFKTYSIEYLRLYLALGSEIDVVAKILCEKIAPSAKADNINTYKKVVLSTYPDFPDVHVVMPRYSISLAPWQAWRIGANPVWWKGYNDVKHERNRFFRAANLENTINALAGLLVFLGYLYSEELLGSRLIPRFDLFEFDRKYWRGSSLRENDGYVSAYCLPGMSKPKRS